MAKLIKGYIVGEAEARAVLKSLGMSENNPHYERLLRIARSSEALSSSNAPAWMVKGLAMQLLSDLAPKYTAETAMTNTLADRNSQRTEQADRDALANFRAWQSKAPRTGSISDQVERYIKTSSPRLSKRARRRIRDLCAAGRITL